MYLLCSSLVDSNISLSRFRPHCFYDQRLRFAALFSILLIERWYDSLCIRPTINPKLLGGQGQPQLWNMRPYNKHTKNKVCRTIAVPYQRTWQICHEFQLLSYGQDAEGVFSVTVSVCRIQFNRCQLGVILWIKVRPHLVFYISC
jgi:hypothetical protein